MKLPRRVPWASISELDQLCSWVYADESDLQTKKSALERLSAWKAITSLPHALESTLALLAVILQDNSPQSSSSALFLRQSYATALIRLVNGLVDPLQSGAYARSIASIAAQLGLPPWLVELRHAATHEDLPSLELLRDAARESMSWLLHNYFLPTLNPSTASQVQAVQLPPLAPILKQYKNLLKITTRDASLQTQYHADIHSAQKTIQRWVAQAKVAANVAAGDPAWDGDEDPKERWALDRLSDSLLEKGALAPLSKKKRTFPTDSFMPPTASVALWTPILTHIHAEHSTFYYVLVHRIIATLLSDPPIGASEEDFRSDPSFDMCLARWAFWAIDSCDINFEDSEADFKRDVTVTLVNGLGPGSTETIQDKKAALALLEAVCAGNQDLQAATKLLLSSSTPSPWHKWAQMDIDEMDTRLNTLLLINGSPSLNGEATSSPQPLPSQKTKGPTGLGPGWQLFDDASNWKPCPIGVYIEGR